MQYVLNDFEYHNLIDSVNAQYTKGRYEGMNITFNALKKEIELYFTRVGESSSKTYDDLKCILSSFEQNYL
jgi:hypothetical protein